MHRRLALAIALLLCATGSARAGLDELAAAARREGTVTWYTGHTDAENASAVGRAFTEKYPEVKISVVRSTSEVAYQRLTQDLKLSMAQCDVFSSTDLAHYALLKADGKLARYVPENAAKLRPEYRDIGDGISYPTMAGLMLLIHNTRKVAAADAPKRWTDLLDPRWKDQLSVGHPGFSGYVATWVVTMRKLYGWEYFEKFARNRPQIGRSGNDPITVLNSGERSAAVGPLGTTLKSADRGNPLAIIYPTDGSLLMISPTAILANAPHPNAARLFLEFLLDVEHARIAVRDRWESLRPEVDPAPGSVPFSSLKLIVPTVEDNVKGVPEVVERWRDLFGG
ncbi:MAG: extracellular solute-binding protein [Proteobacteria bacterium]|nr:extracellular solute-binding protein [Pseudomonadota bacterium]